ncbi:MULTISPECIES: helix-turn-helix domain-containing protein [unclassified Candidatus Frackibacter]|uniref:helix-turn-helix domain-containing protein n=1 Tax=unclassified Candidatus Frackibacter TaxID=2648818 RepID=UPI00088B8583|nr:MULTISPECIES: helix-turn-helix transcriptional regulator [unclassified Candidatus Frackibacter]SDC82570.1 DNA-binding transcriptional regulator, XRE-family HTH domain [Candidatus Frackibacter sp. WG11]SEM97039.1 DNA-binding transcriptional regulator, XRE-family HTH domain [Candidatus Frackibacter sp. WG12]SFM05668.1 DNA-binding transcriptional regulator, XRE-family HTH domain [Candidatus Frackibacter sp. WG13]
MTLGKRIREFRKERGLTLKELSKKIGISYSFLSAIERNIKKPSLTTIKQIAETLNIPITYLFDNSPGGKTIGDKLKLIREGRSLSIAELAELTNIKEEELINLETNKSQPDLDTIEVLANTLDVTVRYFLEKSTNELKVGQRIKKIRQAQGMTVAKLADNSGVSSGLISQIENQQTLPSVDSLENIAEALGTSVCYFLLEQEDIEDLLSSLSPDIREMLGDPRVQGVLRAVRDFDKGELKYILNHIQFFRQNRDLLIK